MTSRDDDFAQWLAENPAPSLADLVQQHGGYSAITPQAWAEYDRAVVNWQLRRRERHGGAFPNQPAKAFQQLRHNVARRAARIRRTRESVQK
jgi:hypothetical protein